MVKTFFVLWIFIGSGRTQTLSVDHYATQAECEAARTAILIHNRTEAGPGYYRYIEPEKIVCLEAKVME